MNGIRFGAYHSYDDLQLVLSKKEMGSPAVKKNKLDIPGADSAIDQTDFFGEPKYDDVDHRFTFTSILPHSAFLDQHSRIKNAIHGKRLKIILDDDPAFFYVGRCDVSGFTSEKGVGTVVVTCDCNPYKYKQELTTVTRAIDGIETLTLTNGRKRAVPEVIITTGTTMRITYQGVNVWDLGSGSYTLPELELVEGDNAVEVSGTGTISFAWQWGEM